MKGFILTGPKFCLLWFSSLATTQYTAPFWAVLGVELIALHLLGSTTWTTLPALIALVIYLFFIFLVVLGFETQGLTLAKQELYYLIHSASPFLCQFLFFLSFFFLSRIGVWTQGFMLTKQALSHVSQSPVSSLFCSGYFGDRVLQTICLSWPQTKILLISASWVPRITGVCQQCLTCIGYFEIRSHFMPGLAWTVILLFVLPAIAGMTGMYHYTQLLVKMEVSWTFCSGWFWIVIIPIYASQVVRIAGLSYHIWPTSNIFLHFDIDSKYVS
jgi:hypothetical protein